MVGNLRVLFKEIQMGKKKKKTTIKPELVKPEDAFDQKFGGPFKKFDQAIKDAGFLIDIPSYRGRKGFKGTF